MVTTRSFRFGINAGGSEHAAELITLACMAEELGYSVFNCSDHLNYPAAELEPMVTLATVAASTTMLEVQPLVLANGLRHPALLYKQAATLDVLSGGRFSLGIGAGWYPPDFTAPGIAFDTPAVRIGRLFEALEIFKALQTSTPVNFQGEHYTITGLTGSPQPIRSPIPVFIGGAGPVMLQQAARIADTIGLNLGLPLGFSIPETSTPFADITDMKLKWIKAGAGGRFDDLELQTTVFAGGITDGDTAALLAPLAEMIGVSIETLKDCPHVLAGTLEECVETVQRWRARWGISYVTIPGSVVREFGPLVSALRGK